MDSRLVGPVHLRSEDGDENAEVETSLGVTVSFIEFHKRAKEGFALFEFDDRAVFGTEWDSARVGSCDSAGVASCDSSRRLNHFHIVVELAPFNSCRTKSLYLLIFQTQKYFQNIQKFSSKNEKNFIVLCVMSLKINDFFAEKILQFSIVILSFDKIGKIKYSESHCTTFKLR